MKPGTPTTSWLAIKAGLSKRQAAGMLHQAHDLAEHAQIAQAATEGRISVNQARAIHTVLGGLDGLDQPQQAKAEVLLLREERDPLAVTLTPQQRRADALVAMITAHTDGRRAPKVGGDRPRVIITLDYDKLLHDAAGAGLIGDGEPLSPGDLRRLCCEADLLPAVLGGPSAILDVGRDTRLVTPDIRAALILRDGGCVFPGCHAHPTEYEAHHIIPWWNGGVIALWNLILLCHHSTP